MAETVHSCDEYCVEHHEKVDDSPVGKLLKGAIDSHLHFSPDSMPRRYNALESALKAQEAGLRGIVIKNHTYPTAPSPVWSVSWYLTWPWSVGLPVHRRYAQVRPQ
ncbi:MAG: hypothetical protein IIB13_02465 [Chloroflexi bacterium]|nr:hypothetical protein [Chloroflexota bacterium]